MTDTTHGAGWSVTIRARLSQLRTRWRRWRLLRAYAGVFTGKTDKCVGFTPVISAYERADRDDILSFEGGDVVWHCPEDSENA